MRQLIALQEVLRGDFVEATKALSGLSDKELANLTTAAKAVSDAATYIRTNRQRSA